MTEPDPHWVERVKALGAAQARYLWALLILMLFYAALHLQTDPGRETTEIPLVGLKISSILVLSSATGMLALIVLAITGSMRALRRAQEQAFRGGTPEEFDLHPNLIDLAFYAPPKSEGLFVHLARAMYAVFMSLALVEAVWLGRHMGDSRLPTMYVAIITVLGILLWGCAAWLLGHEWRRTISYYATVLRRPK